MKVLITLFFIALSVISISYFADILSQRVRGNPNASVALLDSPSHQIIKVWCKQNKVVVRSPSDGKWKLLVLEGQCAESCVASANRIQVVNDKCQWLSAKELPEKPAPPKAEKDLPPLEPRYD